jgi:hypothetical protein
MRKCGLHNRTSSAHPLLPTDGLDGKAQSSNFTCNRRYEARLQAEVRSHQADDRSDEKSAQRKLQQQDALRDVQDCLGLCGKLAEQYPHGLPVGMIRRLKREHNLSEVPGHLGFGQQ